MEHLLRNIRDQARFSPRSLAHTCTPFRHVNACTHVHLASHVTFAALWSLSLGTQAGGSVADRVQAKLTSLKGAFAFPSILSCQS